MGGGPCSSLGEAAGGSCRILAAWWRRMEASLNRAVARTPVGRYFKLESRKSTFTRELRAGAATFLTMAYIISLNAAILADSGGTCTAADCSPPFAAELGHLGNLTGDGAGAQSGHHRSVHSHENCKFVPNDGYQKCLDRTRSDLVVATVVSAMAGCLAMGSLANLPLALAPGMGANTYFVYNLVGLHGSGPVPYRTALAVVLVEGCVFFVLSATGLRGRLARLIPRPIRLAAAAGIGLFLAFVGLQGHQGVGLVGPSPVTLVTLSACAHVDPLTGMCTGGKMRSPTFWLGFSGFLLASFCMVKEIKGGMIYGVLFVTLVSWVRGTAVTAFPDTPVGRRSYDYFSKVVDFHSIESTAGAISFSGFNRSEVWTALATLLYVDILDTTGTMYSLAELGGFVDETKGSFEGEYMAFLVDGGATVLGSALGSSTVTTYVESTAGIKEGGRTGITAITVGLCFLLSLFFTPLLTSVPPWAVGPALVLVGAMMMAGVAREVDWGSPGDALPAVVTMLLMPLTYSIANGIIGGLALYVALRLYDWAAAAARWVAEMRRVMREAQNQVSAAGGDAPSTPV
ncbi:hypothetical protein Taro_038697 [Colocasia esculenta]|uniref:Adenine/guanine permease AZG2 n=1 Tax=Colocasia esculenta TaxID=4460 RepID=A0A843W7E3_COLES|nr:hypothetical protein [Colocasia esculenta]